jgi:hypothetical protein
MSLPQHRWTEGDDIVALYLSRHGCRFLPLMEAGIAKLLGMPQSSLTMRQGNFGYLDGRRGLAHVAEQSREIHQRYGKMTEPELRPLALKVLEAKKGAAAAQPARARADPDR